MRLLFTLSPLLVALNACKLPDVNLATPEPIEVNLNMRLDVYQYTGDEPKDKEAQKTVAEANERKRNRMAEVQTLKDNRLVGENHLGLLQVKELPAGKWGEYVKKTVDEENEDRNTLMRNEAETQQKTLTEVQTEQWKLRLEKAYKGEFIEAPNETGSGYKWIQAEGPKLKATETPAP
jgi:hypothetical protein